MIFVLLVIFTVTAGTCFHWRTTLNVSCVFSNFVVHISAYDLVSIRSLSMKKY